jgi:23S rRNA pseudouridine1911/1915/1917 synthase
MTVSRKDDSYDVLRGRVLVPGELDGAPLARMVSELCGVAEDEAAGIVRFGSVKLDGKTCREPEERVRKGQRVFLLHDRRTITSRPPEPTIVHQDELVAVVGKPAGMPVQRTRLGAGNSLEEWLVTRGVAGASGAVGACIVHRLDMPVSGLMVVARRPAAAATLTRGFQRQEVSKIYLAVSSGTSEESALQSPQGMRVDAPLLWLSGRQRAIIAPEGKVALSVVRRVARRPSECRDAGAVDVLAVKLVTGRTHQARAHLAHVGLPLCGDRVYGDGRGGRVALHAAGLRFPHPGSGEPLACYLPPPEDFWAVAGLDGDADRALAESCRTVVEEMRDYAAPRP